MVATSLRKCGEAIYLESSNLTCNVFRTVVEPTLTWGSEIRTLKAKEVKPTNLRRVQNISWIHHFTLSQLYGDLQSLSVTITKRRVQFAGHAFRVKDEIITNLFLWKASIGRKLTFPDTISRDTGIKVEDILATMPNKTVWCQIVRDISPTVAWWWWWESASIFTSTSKNNCSLVTSTSIWE